MKRLLFAAVLAATPFPALANDVGASISNGQPGFYGRIDIDGYPRPQVINALPRVMYRAAMNRPPIYMHAPPGHAKNWRKHCRAYDACGERVYFVQNSWYDRDYVSHYRAKHRDDQRDGHRGQPNDKRGNKQGHGNNR